MGGSVLQTARKACVALGYGCCPRVEVDTAKLFGFFEANGWQVTDAIEEADLVVVMTCGFCEMWENRNLRLLEVAESRRRPGSRLVVAGCLAGIDEPRLRETCHGDLVPPKDASRLNDIIGASIRLDEIGDPILIESLIERARGCFSQQERRSDETRSRAVCHRLAELIGVAQGPKEGQASSEAVCTIRVAWGCLGECSYCAIRFAAGPLRSKPLAKVLDQFDQGLRLGCKDFEVVAGDLGSYGQDLGSNIVDLLAGLMERSPAFRLHLQDFDPKWLVRYHEPLVSLLAENASRVASIIIPVQSGSDRVLARMRRGHTAAEAQAAVAAVRAACPTAALETHVLIGFPGETDVDFQDTLKLLQACRFDNVTCYNYEDRPNTEASEMRPKVPRRTMKARGFRLKREIEGLRSAVRYFANDMGLR